MSKKLLIFIAAILSIAAVGQTEIELVYQLFDAQNMRTNIEQMMLASIQGQMQANPQFAPYQAELTAFCRKHLRFDAIRKDLAEVYLRYFSTQEIKDMIAFYKSPAGKKMVQKTIPLMKETTLLIQKQITEHSDELIRAISTKAAQQKIQP